MKQALLIITIGFLHFNFTTAQNAIPNAGFENWTPASGYENPTGWNTLNSSTVFLQVTTVNKSTDSHSGTYSLKSETKLIGPPINQTAPGLVTTGTINTTTRAISGGNSYTLRPDSIAGWFKYAPAAGDTGYVEVLLMAQNDNDTIARARFNQTTAVSTWKRFSAPFEYFSSANPDHSRIILMPSSGFTPKVGSVIHFDDLEMVFPTSIHEFPETADFAAYPNPASTELFVNNNQNKDASQIRIYDYSGKKVFSSTLTELKNRLDVSALAPGSYIYMLSSDKKEILNSGKFQIVR